MSGRETIMEADALSGRVTIMEGGRIERTRNYHPMRPHNYHHLRPPSNGGCRGEPPKGS